MIGIDPGVTGAIAIITGRMSTVIDIPVEISGKGKVKKRVNACAMGDVLKLCHRETLYLEKTSSMPGQGVASMYSMGDTYGSIRGVAAALGIEVVEVRPQDWKAYYGLKKDKNLALSLARIMFPTAELHLQKHHNRAEALLIAAYGIDHEKTRKIQVS